MENLHINQLKHAYTDKSSDKLIKPNAIFKQFPEDFIVIEKLTFQPENKGSHAFLKIQKKDTNTQWVIKELAKFCQVPEKTIGYAGLKDRQAITTQWFSVNLEGITEPNWDKFDVDNIDILEQTYHPKKLKVGTIESNHFEIKLKNISSEHINKIHNIQAKISSSGFPNYFGEQRFGIDEQNIAKARRWFNSEIKVKQRNQKSIYLSAARSLLFNEFLSSRIAQFGWNNLINGEQMILDGSHSFFTVEKISKEIEERFTLGDIHPSLSLWGKGNLTSLNELNEFEQLQAYKLSFWANHLENKGLKQDRRSIRVIPKDLQSSYDPETQSFKIKFSLPSGTYATMLLRELFDLQQPIRKSHDSLR